MTWAIATVAGGVGAVARYVVSGRVQRRATGEFPIGTLAVNLTGAFALGLAASGLAGLDRTFVAGFLGGFTTFSTWMVETLGLAEEGRAGRRVAALNLLTHVIGGLALAGLGYLIGR